MSEAGRISSRRVHSGKVIDLDIDDVRFPDGTSGPLEIVRHAGASAVVPMLSEVTGADPQLLLIKQYRYATDGYLLEIPAGRLNAGEPPEVCARRELLEETGCSASKLTFLSTMWTTPGFTDERIHLYMAEGLTAGESKREADEFIELVPMLLSEALGKIKAGEIQDAKTAMAILFVAGFKAGR